MLYYCNKSNNTLISQCPFIRSLIENEIAWWNKWLEKCAINPETVDLIDKIFKHIQMFGFESFKRHKKKMKEYYEKDI